MKPVCRYYLQSECTNPNCRFLHPLEYPVYVYATADSDIHPDELRAGLLSDPGMAAEADRIWVENYQWFCQQGEGGVDVVEHPDYFCMPFDVDAVTAEVDELRRAGRLRPMAPGRGEGGERRGGHDRARGGFGGERFGGRDNQNRDRDNFSRDSQGFGRNGQNRDFQSFPNTNINRQSSGRGAYNRENQQAGYERDQPFYRHQAAHSYDPHPPNQQAQFGRNQFQYNDQPGYNRRMPYEDEGPAPFNRNRTNAFNNNRTNTFNRGGHEDVSYRQSTGRFQGQRYDSQAGNGPISRQEWGRPQQGGSQRWGAPRPPQSTGWFSGRPESGAPLSGPQSFDRPAGPTQETEPDDSPEYSYRNVPYNYK